MRRLRVRLGVLVLAHRVVGSCSLGVLGDSHVTAEPVSTLNPDGHIDFRTPLSS
jgi:hypothetical protein